jgi:hypothetical protein
VIWNKAWVWGWVAILLGLAFYEFWSGWGTGKHTPMLTQITVKYCPWYVTLGFLTWLWIHFALRYFNSGYVKSLDTGQPYKGFI